ncbi:Broad specificity phosphatase PhoE [Loktanella fryxellensis]|uniref:Broad specificity phosphatase PhoE n=1 Tax=Loktanella fryxellensis TaxID=245187 RepID=A0A1H8D926_9RHOB|nr:histidine phosphatase family protein [Loktanella fryxellensis]SEN03344.1 Broad specificity phosphatase PhoE [Loktanella fryxellensis]
MTRLWLIRHGPTHQTAMTGWRDVPADLSDSAALARLSAYVPAPALVVSSDLIRAVTTADAIAQDRQRLPHDPDLREIDFGAWDGLHYTQVAARDPVLSRAFWDTPGDLAAPEGESWNVMTARVTAAIDRVIAAHRPADLVVVAHMGAIMSQIPRATGGTAVQAMGHHIDALGVTDMTLTPQGWRIGTINHRP